MEKLVIDHSYALGIAWDRTQYRNHGITYQTPPGNGYFNGCLSFVPGRSYPGASVVVPPSPSLAELGLVRVKANVYLQNSGRRYNICEGHLAFAFFVNPDLSLQGTFFDPQGNWVGITSAAGALTLNRFHNVEFFYDGISAATLSIDGHQLASTWDSGAVMLGPVRGVGPHGVFVGHWPELDDRYTFDGFVRSFQLYKRDDLDDLLKLLDPCCLKELKSWFDLGDNLRKKGYDQQYLDQIRHELTTAGTSLVARLRDNDPQRIAALNQATQQLLYSIAHRGTIPTAHIAQAIQNLADLIRKYAGPQMAQQVQADWAKLVAVLKLPLDEKELLSLADKLCFSKVKDAMEQVARSVARAGKPAGETTNPPTVPGITAAKTGDTAGPNASAKPSLKSRRKR